MKAFVPAIAVVAVLFASVAANAQTATTPAGSKSGLGGVPAAPVGHRQPRAADVPKADTQADLDAADRALDRKIRSICRGC